MPYEFPAPCEHALVAIVHGPHAFNRQVGGFITGEWCAGYAAPGPDFKDPTPAEERESKLAELRKQYGSAPPFLFPPYFQH